MKTWLPAILLLSSGIIAANDLTSLIAKTAASGYETKIDITVHTPTDPTPCEILGIAETTQRIAHMQLHMGKPITFPRFPDKPGTVILLREKLRPGDPVPNWVKERSKTLQADQALLVVFSKKSQPYFLILGQGRSLHKAAAAFWGRYPYLNELYGSGISPTYQQISDNLYTFTACRYDLVGLIYDFPTRVDLHPLNLAQFRFAPLIVNRLLAVSEAPNSTAVARLRDLVAKRNRGIDRSVLSWSDVALLETITGQETVLVPRSGATLAELNPAFKPLQKKKVKPYSASLEKLLTPSGLLWDGNDDGLADTLKAPVVINEKEIVPELIDLCSRFAALLPGAAFPFFLFDDELTDLAEIEFPILYGRTNRFVRELIEKGKLSETELTESRIQIVNNTPWAFPVLVVTDREALRFLAGHLPSLQEFDWGRPTLPDSLRRFQDYFQAEAGGDIFYFHSLVSSEKADHVSGTVSDRFPLDLVRSLLGDRKNLVKPWNQEKQVQKWSFSIPGEATRIRGELQKKLDPKPVRIELRLSESPEYRSRLTTELNREFAPVTFEVNSAYKFAYFYIRERFLPLVRELKPDRIVIRVPILRQDSKQPRRFYADGQRWLQEIYPIDEVIAGELGIPLDRIEIGLDDQQDQRYCLEAFVGDRLVEHSEIPVYTYQRPYLSPFPGWGQVEVAGGSIILFAADGSSRQSFFPTDLEVFWNRYQDEVLPFLQEYIAKKTAQNPKLDNQPFFKQLKIDLRLSEPDFRTGIDQEMISPLEAIHDEIYFDTLDFMAGLLRIEPSDKEFNLRKSSPGNVLPLIRPAPDGAEGLVEITLTETESDKPRLLLHQGKKETKREFPDLREVKIEWTGLKIEKGEPIGDFRIDCTREADFTAVNRILDSLKELAASGVLGHEDPILVGLSVETIWKTDHRRFSLPTYRIEPLPLSSLSKRFKGLLSSEKTLPQLPIPSSILTHTQMEQYTRRLGALPGIRTFTAGTSHEKRSLPALFACDPELGEVSLPKLLIDRPTLFFSARQHANEVSATTYSLQELSDLVSDPGRRPLLTTLNLLLLPMENPDGADLAYDLQKHTPFHSLHAGRYTSKGVDVGYVQDEDRPAVSEALARPLLNRVFLPDLHLNLHGYPSHEWVQPFSGYAPFLFRNYWIPKGIFLYYSYLNRPEADEFSKLGEDLLDHLGRGLAEIPGNHRLLDRYRRWSERWAPHLNFLDIVEGSLIFHSRENAGYKKVPQPTLQLASETPELMDETAQGEWLEEVLRQGRTYLRLHLDFFARLKQRYVIDHYAAGERVFLLHKRLRPGSIVD